MSHECDDCGQEFDTLTRLRLHDCSTADSSDRNTVDSSENEDGTPSEWADRRPEAVELGALDELLTDTTDGEFDTLSQAMATYESELDSPLHGFEISSEISHSGHLLQEQSLSLD